MAIWELRVLAKLIGRMKLKFWETVLNDYVEMQEENNKYKFHKKMLKQELLKLRVTIQGKKLRKKY